ncbi:MAG: transglycosylase domain-containing protein [bacterium]|nr:transglycosylase domain-containing protein [bacterium]
MSDKLRRRNSRIKGNKFTTKSGKTIKLNRTLLERTKARHEAKALRKAERMRGMPKSRVKRVLYRLHPKRLYKYWFSRDGAIMALKLGGIAIVVMFFGLMAVFAYFRKDLPNLKDISGDTVGGSVRYYDRTGQTLLWEDYDAVKRTPVTDEQISQYLKDATIAIEDREFFNHSGFNVKGITRAAWNNAFGGSTQGGSTITQQVVKLNNADFINQRTLTRKIKELILSVELERSYSKKEILSGYLNTAPYGGVEYGVEVASKTYFHKSAKDLSIGEAAFLAAIPKSPRYYSPYSEDFDPVAFKGRTDYVIDVMQQMNKITQEEATTAKAVDVVATIKQREPKYTGIVAPHFVLAAKRQVEKDRSEQGYIKGGLSIITTLDMEKQKIAEDEVAQSMPTIKRNGFDTAAFVAEDVKTGQVVALVGGADFFDKTRAGEINYAQTMLPPGSSFKPYDYLALMEKKDNVGAGTVIFDTQGPLEGYPCTNKAKPKQGGNCLHDYDLRYPGPVTVRYALGGSRNVPAVKAMLMAGVNETINVANSLGLSGDDAGGGSGYRCFEDDNLTKQGDCYGSSAIGDGAYLSLDRHVHSFATISRNGNKIPQTYVLEIKDSQGDTVQKWEPSQGEQVVRADSAYIVADIMSDPNASYFTRKPHRYLGWNFSLKTGTTNDSKDGLLMGFSTQYSAGVWVGHHTRRVETRAFMESMTEPIWSGWMQRVHKDLQPEARQKPAGVQTLPAYVIRSHVGTGTVEPSPTNDLFPSWYKKPKVTVEKKTIDVISNKIATDCTPELARKEQSDSAAQSFSGDSLVSGGASSSSSGEKDDVHQCSDTKPSVGVTILPKSGGVYTITANYNQGTHPLSAEGRPTGTVTIKVNGQPIPGGSLQVTAPGSTSIDYTATSAGSQSVSAEITDSVLYTNSVTISYTFATGSPDASPGPGATLNNNNGRGNGRGALVTAITITA